jgi:hypothetical protein
MELAWEACDAWEPVGGECAASLRPLDAKPAAERGTKPVSWCAPSSVGSEVSGFCQL